MVRGCFKNAWSRMCTISYLTAPPGMLPYQYRLVCSVLLYLFTVDFFQTKQLDAFPMYIEADKAIFIREVFLLPISCDENIKIGFVDIVANITSFWRGSCGYAQQFQTLPGSLTFVCTLMDFFMKSRFVNWLTSRWYLRIFHFIAIFFFIFLFKNITRILSSRILIDFSLAQVRQSGIN